MTIDFYMNTFLTQASQSLKKLFRNICYSGAVAVLCLAGTSCSKDWANDLSIYEDDPLRELSLCVAYEDDDTGFHLLLDNGDILIPKKGQSFDILDGGRYKVHYAIRSYNRDNITAHIFELFPIDLIPCVESHSGEKKTDPVSIERFWSAGGYLNLSFICHCEGVANQGHQLHYVLTELPDKSIALSLEHQCLQAGDKACSHTLSTPLDSIFKDMEISHLKVYAHELSNNNEVINAYTVF